MDKPKFMKLVTEAAESAGGKVKEIRSVPADDIAASVGDSAVGDGSGFSLISREFIQDHIKSEDEYWSNMSRMFDEELGKDQGIFSRRSTSTVLCLVKQDRRALAYLMDTYIEEAEREGASESIDVPTPKELAQFQASLGVRQVSYALEVGVFGGAILGRGGFTSEEIIRLMAEPAFTVKVLTLRYRPEELCSMARETLERLNEISTSKNPNAN